MFWPRSQVGEWWILDLKAALSDLRHLMLSVAWHNLSAPVSKEKKHLLHNITTTLVLRGKKKIKFIILNQVLVPFQSYRCQKSQRIKVPLEVPSDTNKTQNSEVPNLLFCPVDHIDLDTLESSDVDLENLKIRWVWYSVRMFPNASLIWRMLLMPL